MTERLFPVRRMRVLLRHSRARERPQCSEQEPKAGRAAGRHSEEICVPGPVCAPLLVQQWLQSLPGSDLVWIPGSGLWICLCFHDNPVLCKPCLLTGCYIWIPPCNPAYAFNLSQWLRPCFSLVHPTPGFQLHSTLPSCHAIHAHIQTPASGHRVQTAPLPGSFNIGLLDTLSMYDDGDPVASQ